MIKFLPLDFFGISWKNKNAVYRLQISTNFCVPEIFKYEKCVKYANEKTYDVMYSTQYYTKYTNKVIMVNFQHSWPLTLGRLIV